MVNGDSGNCFSREIARTPRFSLVREVLDAPIEHIALENPVGVLSTQIRPPTQIIQPWQFGHAELKTTCLWLKNLPRLEPTNIVRDGIDKLRVRDEPRSPTRWKTRSRTYTGIADAMAEQWGRLDPVSAQLRRVSVQDPQDARL